MNDLELIARDLEATGDFRVLRRLKTRSSPRPPEGISTKTGIFLDVETTGLDLANSEAIELAAVPFEYTAEGRIFQLGQALHQFNKPVDPIPDEITALTGLTDEFVAGHRFDAGMIERFVESAALIVAHNAAFDRPFAERISPIFKAKPWACSMCGVPWSKEGIRSRRLTDLLARYGFFFESHRAVDDCLAAIELLGMALPKSGRLVMAALLDEARIATYRISAENAPFEAKGLLKARGYHWNAEIERGPRAWWIEVTDKEVEEELAFLEREVFCGFADIPISKITAFERFSIP